MVSKNYKVSILNNKYKKRRTIKWKGKGGAKTPHNTTTSFKNLSTKYYNSVNNNTFTITPKRKHTIVIKPEIINLQKKSQKSKIATVKKIYKNLSIIEITDTLIQIQYETLDREKYYFVIALDKLSIDRLQYYINTNQITQIKDYDNYYLGLNENTLLVNIFNTGGQYRTGSSDDFINVYESKEIDMISYEENMQKMLSSNIFEINVDLLNEKDRVKEKPRITKDISWINNIYMDINSTNNVKGIKNIDYFLEQYKIKNINPDIKIFNCDDLNIDHTKLIIDYCDIIDKEKYVIIGYPDKSMKPYIDLYNKNKDEFNSIYTDHKIHFIKYMAELHNVFNKKNTSKHINDESKIKLENEIHNFYAYDAYYKYIENFYNTVLLKDSTPEYPIRTDYGVEYNPTFQDKFKELQKAFYNELAHKCINKPNIKINYNFLIFKKHSEEGNYKDMYVPAIFNFRQLTYKHKDILVRLETLIKKRLSYIYDIIKDETKEDYKLWYSHYNYGDIFHIKTEYVHTMSNIQQQAYKYKNSISLEELIYMLKIPNIELINLRLDYQKKDFEFSKGIKNLVTYLSSKKDNIHINNKCKNLEALEIIKIEEIVNIDGFLDINTKILLMFVETGNIYTIIYKNGKDNKFYKLKLKSNLCSIYIEILKKLYNVIDNINIFRDFIDECKKKPMQKLDLSKIHNIKGLKLYKVIENRIINSDDYKNVMRYNPLLIRTIEKKDNKSKNIKMSSFLQSPLVKLSDLQFTDIIIPNPFYKKSLIIRNFLATQQFKDQFEIFKNLIVKNPNVSYTYKSDPEVIHIPNENVFTLNYIGNNYTNQEINCIYFNPGNCRYTFIEIKVKNPDKKVVWIVPLNATYSEVVNEPPDVFFKENIPPFLGNCLNLNKSHISMLEIFNKLYYIDNEECFFNIASLQTTAYSMHIHVFQNLTYKSSMAIYEQGSRIDKFLNTKTTINMLNLSKVYDYDYYNNYNTQMLIHDKL